MARVVTAAPPASDAIVGRKAELDSLTQFAGEIPLGPTALMLNGEQGIGKTTLWKWGLQVAQEHSCRVLSTRPSEAETRLPYAGLGDLLYQITEDELAVLPSTQQRALEVALLRAEAEGPPLEQRTISVGLLGVISHLSRSGPVLVAVDDVQWLDVPSQRVLRFALRRLDDQPIGVLVSARTSNPDEDPFGLDRTFAVGRVGYLFVEPLDEAAVDELLHARLATRFPRPIVRRVHRTSGGNPFYALELGRALLRKGVPTALGERLPVPETLRELVLDRLFRLPGTVREVLLTVAALSRPTVAQVEQALGHRERTAAAIARAVRAGVVECDNGDVRFTHPLFGSVLYGDASVEAKRKLHRSLAPVVPDLEERAQHLGLGADSPDAAVSAALDDAARRARARGAPDAAAALTEHARRLTPADQPDQAHRRTREAASDHLEAGDTARARLLLEELAAEAADGPDRARALAALSRVLVYDESYHASERLLQHALDVAGDDPSLRAAIERDLVTAIVQTSDLRRAEPHARRALEWAERAGDPALVSGALAHLAMVEFLRGRGIRVKLMERALDLEHQATGENPADATPVLPTNLVWGGLLKWADEFDAARERFEAVRQQAAARGGESTWVSLLFQHGELELWAGNWQLAARYAREAEAIAVRSLQPAMPDYVYLAAAVAAHLGQVDEARADANAALSQAQRVGDLRFELRSEAILGFIELSLGEAAAAQPYLERAVDLYAGAGYDDPGVIRFLPDAVEALVAFGELERAEPLVDHLEERSTTLRRPYAQVTALRCRGLVHAAAGNMSAAVSALGQAVDSHARLPQPFELGRTLLIHGVVQRRLKQKRVARASLRDALEIFERLGARLWSDRARSELERVGGRPPTPAALTPTERRLADLVTAGYTNREIADEMFLSVKTVEANLTRIYRKLGVRSRRELARRSKTGNLPDSESIPSS